MAGSTVEIVQTNFVNNSFTGAGTVVVLDGGSVNVSMNYGTPDDGLVCEFVALSPTTDDNFTCIDYDLESPNVSDLLFLVECWLFSMIYIT